MSPFLYCVCFPVAQIPITSNTRRKDMVWIAVWGYNSSRPGRHGGLGAVATAAGAADSLCLGQQNRQRPATREAAPIGDSFLLISSLLKSLPPPPNRAPGRTDAKTHDPMGGRFPCEPWWNTAAPCRSCAQTSGLRCCETFNLVRHREGERTVLSEDLYLLLELSVWLDFVHLPIRLTLQKECRAGHWEPGSSPQFLRVQS